MNRTKLCALTTSLMFAAIGCKTMPQSQANIKEALNAESGQYTVDPSVKQFAMEELQALDSQLAAQYKDAVEKQKLYDEGKPGGKDMRFDTENYWDGLPKLKASAEAIYDHFLFVSRGDFKTDTIKDYLDKDGFNKFLAATQDIYDQFKSAFDRFINAEGYNTLLLERLKVERDYFKDRMTAVADDIKKSKKQGGMTKSIERLLSNYADQYYRRVALLTDIYERYFARLVVVEGMSESSARDAVRRMREERSIGY